MLRSVARILNFGAGAPSVSLFCLLLGPATLTDVYPTLCELAGIPIPDQCDGDSLVPQLRQPEAPKQQLAVTSFQFGREKSPSHAVADSRYRFIRYGNGFEELYDLETDPQEFNNRVDDPKLIDVKSRLAKSIPANAAPNRGIPIDSRHNRNRGRKASNK